MQRRAQGEEVGTIREHFGSIGLGSLVAAALMLNTPAVAGGRDDLTLTVAYDRNVAPLADVEVLAEQLRDATQFSASEIETSGNSDQTAITVTIRDPAHDGQVADAIQRHFAALSGYRVDRAAALTIRISYSTSALNAFGPKRLERDAVTLVEVVNSLRTPIPGVTIEPDPDGAIVRSTNPDFGMVLKRENNAAFETTPLSRFSWRVTLGDEVRKLSPPGRKLWIVHNIDALLRQTLGDPLDLSVVTSDTDSIVTVPNPDQWPGFLKNVRRTFGHNPDFVLKESSAIILTVELPKHIAKANDPVVPDDQGDSYRAMEAIDELINPPVDVAIVDKSVSVRAHDPAHNADRAALFRKTLQDRKDLVIAMQPDGSLLVSLIPGAHLVPPPPKLGPGQLIDGIKAQLDALKISARIKALGDERAELNFSSKADAETFRKSVSTHWGLEFRLVDDGEGDNTPPSPGDVQLALPDGSKIWVEPIALITGDMVADASVGTSSRDQEPIIQFRFTEEGAARFALATRANVGRRFAIIIDGKAIEAPVIQDAITGGSGEISGAFTADSAAALVKAILAHRKELPLKIIEGG